MIFKYFLNHQIKETMRSSIWQKQLVLNLVIGFFLLLMMAYLVFLGLMMDRVLGELFPESDPFGVFTSGILYYIGIEFLMRFFIQSLPVLNIESYLQLPIKKNSIVHYVASKSIFSIGNYLSWLVFIPFAFRAIAPEYGTGQALIWILGMIVLIYSNNFLATYFKRQLVYKPRVIGLFAIFLVAVFALEKLEVYSLSLASTKFFTGLLSGYNIFILIFILIFSYLLNYNFLKSRLYPDEINHKKKSRKDQLGEISYLKRIGLTGELISLELRLLWRHKRTRSIFVMAPLFLLYGLIFYNDMYDMNSGILIFVGIFMTGGMMLNYTNYCFGYESNYFDSILVNYTDYGQYLRVKYILAVSIASICYLLTIPYFLIDKYLLLINTATYLYNIGFLAYVLIYTGTYTTKRLDLSKNASFNYQGMGATHWLSMLPAFLLPILIFLPFKHFGNPLVGHILIGVLGLIGILLNKTFINILEKQFLRKRHIMAKGFRTS